MRRLAGHAALLLVLAAAGCGGGGKKAAAACVVPPRIGADIRAIARAANLPTKDTLKGNRAINRATDAFLYDVETAPIGNLQRNRLIDHAAAALGGSCTQCFQALEAERPIPAIAQGNAGCSG